MHGGFWFVEVVAVLPHLVEVGVELEGGTVLVGLQLLFDGPEVDWVFDYFVVIGSCVVCFVDWGQERFCVGVALDELEDPPFLLKS